jgi:type II secretory pathway pseudopilin PulG
MPDSQKNNKQHSINRRNKGQTLIETLAAAFILTMGISASVGLAVYAFNTSGGIVKQIIATGLAREGLEAVRNMRDTNWLKDTLSVNGCYNFATGQANSANCYPDWLGDINLSKVPFCINPTNNSGNCNGSDTTDTYYLGFDSSTQYGWVLKKDSSNFGLNFNDPTKSAAWLTNGFYSPGAGNNGVACSSATSDYCEKITITKVTTAPYNQDDGPLLKVQSQVWWVDKKCPKAADFSTASVTCRLELDTYLTNWKNF